MIKSLFLLVFFVAVSSVAFGQTQQNVTSTGDNVTVTEYDKDPKQVKDKTTTSESTATSTTTTSGSGSNSKTSKSYAKGCCGMNGEKHACCSGMSGKKKMKKKKAGAL